MRTPHLIARLLISCAILPAPVAASAQGIPEPVAPSALLVGAYDDRLVSVTPEGRIQNAPLERPDALETLLDAPVLDEWFLVRFATGPDGKARLLVVSRGKRPEAGRFSIFPPEAPLRFRAIDPSTGRVELDVEHPRMLGRPVGYCPKTERHIVYSELLHKISPDGDVDVLELPRPAGDLELHGDGKVHYRSWRRGVGSLFLYDLVQEEEHIHHGPEGQWKFLGGSGGDFFFSLTRTVPRVVRRYTLVEGRLELTAAYAIEVAQFLEAWESFVPSHRLYLAQSPRVIRRRTLPSGRVGFVTEPQRTHLLRLGDEAETIWSDEGRWAHAGFTSKGEVVMVRMLPERHRLAEDGVWLRDPTEIRIVPLRGDERDAPG